MISVDRSPARPRRMLPLVLGLTVAAAGVGLVVGRQQRPLSAVAAPLKGAKAAPVAARPVAPVPPAKPKGPVSTVVLCYHRIADKPVQETVLPPVQFQQQMAWLRDNRYQVLPLTEVVTALREGTVLPIRSVVLTFDDGFNSDYKVVWPTLQRFGYPATLFIYSDWVGKAAGANTWDGLKEMLASGLIDIQSHTVTHANLVQTARRADGGARLHHELADSKQALEEHLGRTCTILAYPYGANDEKVRAATEAAGYVAALNVDGGALASGDGLYGLSRRMVFRKDSLESFARARVAPRKLLLTAAVPAAGTAVTDRRPALSCTLPADLVPSNLVLRLDGQALPHRWDPASHVVSAAAPVPLSARSHKVSLNVSADGLELSTAWSFSVASGS